MADRLRICIVGNSHTAMLMNALKEGDQGVDATVFAIPGAGPEKARFEGTRLVAWDEVTQGKLSLLGMPHEVDLAGFDGVVFVGSTLSAFGGVAMLSGFRVWGWPGTVRALDAAAGPFAAPMRQQLLSEAALLAGLRAQIEEGATLRLVSELRDRSDVPVIVLPQPFPSVRILKMKDKPKIFRRVAEDGEGGHLADAMQRAHEAVFGRYPRVQVLRQPGRSLRDGFLTRRSYGVGATRINIALAQPKDDVLHANAALGTLYLRRIRARVEELAKRP